MAKRTPPGDELPKRRRDGKPCSDRTYRARNQELAKFKRVSHLLGLKVEKPKNFEDKHFQAVVNHWYWDRHLAPSTMRNSLSTLRVVMSMLGRPNLVKPLHEYLPDVPRSSLRVHSVCARVDTLSDALAKIRDKLALIEVYDPVFAAILRLQLDFGLRRKEAISIYPWEADRGAYLELAQGIAKNGRPRIIPIINEVQREALDAAKACVKPGQRLGWERHANGKLTNFRSREQLYSDKAKFFGLTKACFGITGHSLRKAYVENSLLRQNVVPPTLGGGRHQLPEDQQRELIAAISQALGHNRLRVLGAYVSTFATAKEMCDFASAMRGFIDASRDLALESPSPDRLDDCGQILRFCSELGFHLTLPQAELLWTSHSKRWGTGWMAVTGSLKAALLIAAIAVARTLKQGDQ